MFPERVAVPEHGLTPYEPGDLRGNRVLVLAPHPDDETFLCGGALALHRAHGDPVHVIVLTSGAAGDWDGAGREQILIAREAEVGRALAELDLPEPELWRLEDRGLQADGVLVAQIADALRRHAPTLIYAPSPMDLNPDHRALARALRAAVRGLPEIRVAFCDGAVPVPVTTLIDVTAVWETKARAMAAYRSQASAPTDYVGVVGGLARYRSLTLPGDVTHAEGFRVVPAHALDVDPIWRMAALQAPPAPTGDPEVSVIVRTRDRPHQLREALDSLVDQTFTAFEVVVVNDGGADVGAILADYPTLTLRHVRHEEPRGRGAAAQAGVQAATGGLIAYLDDDDVVHPVHLQTLRDALVHNTGFGAAYAEVDVVRLTVDPETGHFRTVRRAPEYANAFDRGRLLYENYIPNVSLVHTRAAWERVGGFDPGLEYCEDWDFLLRLAAEVAVLHVPRRTAEYRVHDGLSITSLRGWGVVDELPLRAEMLRRHRGRYTDAEQLAALDAFRARATAASAEVAALREHVGVLESLLAPGVAAAVPPPVAVASAADPTRNGASGPHPARDRRAVIRGRLAGAVRHPDRAARWARVLVRDPLCALERLGGSE